MPEYDEDALREDANAHWQKWSQELEKLKLEVDGIVYSRPDFSLAPGSSEVYAAFETSLTTFRTYIETGEEIFEGFARALLDTAIMYMEAEGDVQSEIDAVQREMESL